MARGYRCHLVSGFAGWQMGFVSLEPLATQMPPGPRETHLSNGMIVELTKDFTETTKRSVGVGLSFLCAAKDLYVSVTPTNLIPSRSIRPHIDFVFRNKGRRPALDWRCLRSSVDEVQQNNTIFV